MATKRSSGKGKGRGRAKQTHRKSTDGKAPTAKLAGATPRPSRVQYGGGDRVEPKPAVPTVLGNTLSQGAKRKSRALEPSQSKPAKKSKTGHVAEEDISVAPESIAAGTWEKADEVSNLKACSYCGHGGNLHACDRKGCSELFCEDCVLGIKAGYAKAKAAGLTDEQLWLVCLWCSGKTAPYQGFHGPKGEPVGDRLQVVAPIMGNLARHRPRRPICILDMRLGEPELDDRSAPGGLYRQALLSHYEEEEWYAETITFDLVVRGEDVIADAHEKVMSRLAQRIAKKFKKEDFELVIFITTHVTTEGSDDMRGNLQVVKKSEAQPDGVAIDPWEFFGALFGETWKQLMHEHETTMFMVTCGALIMEPKARSALLDAAVHYNIKTLVAPTTPVNEPMSWCTFYVSWALQVTAARLDPSALMHQLVASAMFHLQNIGLAVYYAAGTTGATRDPRRKADVPAFCRYLWHKMPTVPFGVPQPRSCVECGRVGSWREGEITAQVVKVVCATPGCGNVREVPVPGNLRDTSHEMAGGHWMTELLE